MLIYERPATTQKVGLLARKNGKYIRPITGAIADFRVEDFMPKELLAKLLTAHFVGRLPDIPAIGQVGRYFISEFNDVLTTSASKEDVAKLINQKDSAYILLPATRDDEHFAAVGAPWWEFAVVLDEYGQFVKAPREPREHEAGPDEVDERLDDYPENRGRFQVLSPIVLEKMRVGAVQECYKKRLDRVLGL
jgi:hypothetical protein